MLFIFYKVKIDNVVINGNYIVKFELCFLIGSLKIYI